MSQDRIDALSRSLADATSRRGLLRLLGVGVAGTAITAVGITGAEAERKKAKKAKKVRAQKKKDPLSPNPFSDVPFTGTVDGAPVTGFVEVTRFINDAGTLTAVGNVTGTTAFDGPFTAVVTDIEIPEEGCQILHLELGPLQLDLLGLVVTIPEPIIIDITAVPGAGNLLGNLLCAIVGLLDPDGLVEGIVEELVGLLNRLLRLFG